MPDPKIHPTGESNGAVYDQQLAMVPQVQGEQMHERESRQETRVTNFFPSQDPGNRRPRIVRAGGVDDYADLNTAPDRVSQGVSELLARFVAIKNVSGQRNRMSRLPNCIEHCRVRLIAVDERLDSVARQERARNEFIEGFSETIEMTCA